MKKLLFALLIAFVVSAIVQKEDKELEGFLDFVAKFIASLTGELKKLYNKLKSLGQWDRIVQLVKQRNVIAAISVCSSYTGQNSPCGSLINGIAA